MADAQDSKSCERKLMRVQLPPRPPDTLNTKNMNGTTTQTLTPVGYTPLPPATRMLGRAFSFYKEHWQIVLGISAIPAALGVIQTLLGKSLPGVAFLITIVGVVVAFVARLALFDAVAENGEPAGGIAGAYQKGWHLLIPFVWVSALVTISTLGGFFLFIIPGILLSGWLSLSLYVFFMENRRGIAALTASWHYVKGYWLPVFWRFLFFGIIIGVTGLIIGLVSAAPTFFAALERGTADTVGAEIPLLSQLINLVFNHFIAIPLGIIYAYVVYLSLKSIKGETPYQDEATSHKTTLIVFMVLGIIGLVALIAFASFLLSRGLPEFLNPTSKPDLVLSTPFSAFVSVGFNQIFEFFVR
jgi:hypothetical protein